MNLFRMTNHSILSKSDAVTSEPFDRCARQVEISLSQLNAIEPVLYFPHLQEDERLLAEIRAVGQRLNAEQEALRANGGRSTYALRYAALEEIGVLQMQRDRVISKAKKRRKSGGLNLPM